MTRLVLKMAARNVLEHRRKSVTVGVIVAAAACLFTLGFSVLDTASEGIRKEFRNRITGDLYVTAKTPKPLSAFSWKDMNSLTEPVPRLEGHAKIKSYVEGLAGVESATSRAVGVVQVTSEGGTGKPGAAMLMGVDTNDYEKAFPDGIRVAGGASWTKGSGGLIVSDMAAGTVGREASKPGSSLTLSSMGMGSAIREAEVLGVLEPEDSNPLLSLLSYVDIDTLRHLLGYYLEDGGETGGTPGAKVAPAAAPNEDDLFSVDTVTVGDPAGGSGGDVAKLLSGLADREPPKIDTDAWQYIVVKVKKGASVDGVRATIEGFIKARGLDATVYGWLDGAGQIASTVLSIKDIFNYIAALIALVALLIIMNALVISVTERTAEIGTMRAIGGTRNFVKELIVTETVLLSSVAGVAGMALGAAGVWLTRLIGFRTDNFIFKILFGGEVFRPDLSLPGCAITLAAVVAIGVVASLYPTKIALRVSPSVAMQRD
ncbi:MAG: FtsX-like permease family protein [Spirochaetaceae bacterium]|nr:FtsX-like permease family protein [Spirochaetaceae bacterium]